MRAVDVIDAEPEEAVERVVVPEEAVADGAGQLGQDVVAQLAEHRVVAVDADLIGEPQGLRPPRDRLVGRQLIHQIVLQDVVLLALGEQSADEPQRVVLGRGDAQLVAELAVVIAALDVLGGIDERTGVVGEIGDVGGLLVVQEGVVGVVGLRVVIALQIAAGEGDIEVADLALKREGRLPPLVRDRVGVVARGRQVAGDRRIDGEVAVRLGVLPHENRGDRPVVAEIDLERAARAVGVGVVEALLGEGRRGVAAGRCRVGVGQTNARGRVSELVRDVVDEAAVVLGPPHQTDRGVGGERHVDKALGDVAALAAHRVTLQVIAGLEAAEVRLVGDDAHRAGLGAGAVEGALRTRQGLDALDVVDVQVERALDGGDRLLIEVHADARQRTGMVAVVATRYAAHEGACESRAERLVGDARQELHIVVEVLHPELLELLGADRGDAEWYVLQVLGALLGGDHHFLEGAAGCVGGVQPRYRRHDRGGNRCAPQHERYPPPTGTVRSFQLA